MLQENYLRNVRLAGALFLVAIVASITGSSLIQGVTEGLGGTAGVIINVFVTEPGAAPFLALPMITNELFLGIYLIAKGLVKPQEHEVMPRME